MKIDVARPGEIRRVALAMRERDFDEISALAPADTREELAAFLEQCYTGVPDVLCGHGRDGEPICIGGLIQLRPNVASMLFYATDDFPQIGLQITRFVRNELIPRYMAAGVHRIEAASLADYAQVHRWLGTLGLAPEGGLMFGYGKRGEAFQNFAKVQRAHSTGH